MLLDEGISDDDAVSLSHSEQSSIVKGDSRTKDSSPSNDNDDDDG